MHAAALCSVVQNCTSNNVQCTDVHFPNLLSYGFTKGQKISKAISEIINFPKFDPKI